MPARRPRRRQRGAGPGRARGDRRFAREGRRRVDRGRAGHGIPAARAFPLPAAHHRRQGADPVDRDRAEPRHELHREGGARQGAGGSDALPRDADRHRVAGHAAPRLRPRASREATMQLRAEQLAAHLQKGIGPLYTVWGDEALLAQEAGDAIRAAARASGCTERQVHVVAGNHFDWSGLLGASQALSLFADRQLIEIRIPSGKPGKDGSEALQRYCETAASKLAGDIVTLVQLPKLDRTQQSSAWFAALDASGVDGSRRPGRAQGAAAVDRAAPRRTGPARRRRRGRPAHAGLLRRPRRGQPARRAPGGAEARPAVPARRARASSRSRRRS